MPHFMKQLHFSCEKIKSHNKHKKPDARRFFFQLTCYKIIDSMINFNPARSKTAMLADHRIRIMNEVVSGIRIIKMYAWEIPFSAVVTAVRR